MSKQTLLFHAMPDGLDAHPTEAGGQEIVYLIHLDRAILGRNRRGLTATRHYIGTTCDLGQRLARHRDGRGAAYLREANRRGIGWRVVGWWPGGRQQEIEIKRRLGGRGRARVCPACEREYLPGQLSPATLEKV